MYGLGFKASFSSSTYSEVQGDHNRTITGIENPNTTTLWGS